MHCTVTNIDALHLQALRHSQYRKNWAACSCRMHLLQGGNKQSLLPTCCLGELHHPNKESSTRSATFRSLMRTSQTPATDCPYCQMSPTLRSSADGLGASGSSAAGSSLLLAKLMLARPSVMSTIMTRPTSPVLCAASAVRSAVDRPWARGDPPPQGSWSRRRRAMEMDLLGGSSTSALSP